MSNQSLSASHQVSISHDPLEENRSAGGDRWRTARDGWPSGGRPVARSSFDAADLRPALLAGAIGLFAAWIVSGMRSGNLPPLGASRHRGGRYVADRDEPRSFRQPPQATRGPQTGYSSGGTEGRSSREDFVLDAMNP